MLPSVQSDTRDAVELRLVLDEGRLDSVNAEFAVERHAVVEWTSGRSRDALAFVIVPIDLRAADGVIGTTTILANRGTELHVAARVPFADFLLWHGRASVAEGDVDVELPAAGDAEVRLSYRRLAAVRTLASDCAEMFDGVRVTFVVPEIPMRPADEVRSACVWPHQHSPADAPVVLLFPHTTDSAFLALDPEFAAYESARHPFVVVAVDTANPLGQIAALSDARLLLAALRVPLEDALERPFFVAAATGVGPGGTLALAGAIGAERLWPMGYAVDPDGVDVKAELLNVAGRPGAGPLRWMRAEAGTGLPGRYAAMAAARGGASRSSIAEIAWPFDLDTGRPRASVWRNWVEGDILHTCARTEVADGVDRLGVVVGSERTARVARLIEWADRAGGALYSREVADVPGARAESRSQRAAIMWDALAERIRESGDPTAVIEATPGATPRELPSERPDP